MSKTLIQKANLLSSVEPYMNTELARFRDLKWDISGK